VTITRAKYGMILIGNAKVLYQVKLIFIIGFSLEQFVELLQIQRDSGLRYDPQLQTDYPELPSPIEVYC
jgi:hypothetical protein